MIAFTFKSIFSRPLTRFDSFPLATINWMEAFGGITMAPLLLFSGSAKLPPTLPIAALDNTAKLQNPFSFARRADWLPTNDNQSVELIGDANRGDAGLSRPVDTARAALTAPSVETIEILRSAGPYD
jgi:hypothetical protein